MENYRGRFAPSPTGPLHFGSLVTAVGSFVRAKSLNGKWLIRVEDLDQPRNIAGADSQILTSLELHGLHWDESEQYQSKRLHFYQEALDELFDQQVIYPCKCSRKMVAEARLLTDSEVYPRTCFERSMTRSSKREAIRVKTNSDEISFTDPIQGLFRQQLESEVGDFVIRRADGTFAYQLAVVVDDYQQNISEIVRGSDLLDNTPRQIYLQKLLSFNTPKYLHLPVVNGATGQKLSKQTGAEALDNNAATANLYYALAFLGHTPPSEIKEAPTQELLLWAMENWHTENIPQQLSAVLPPIPSDSNNE